MQIVKAYWHADYDQILQCVPIKFSYLEKIDDNKYRQLFPGVLCREFLCDHFLLDEKTVVYNFEVTYPPVYDGYVYLLTEFPKNKKIKKIEKLKFNNPYVECLHQDKEYGIFRLVNKNPALTSALTTYIKKSLVYRNSGDDCLNYWDMIKVYFDLYPFWIKDHVKLFDKLYKLKFNKNKIRKIEKHNSIIHSSQGIINAIHKTQVFFCSKTYLHVWAYLLLFTKYKDEYLKQFGNAITLDN